MSTSLVALEDRGFWCPDGLLEIFAYYLAPEIEQEGAPWASEYAVHLRTQAQAGLSGCIDFKLSSLGVKERGALADAAAETSLSLHRDPALLSAEALNKARLGGGAEFERAVDVQHVARVATAFEELLRGRLALKPESEQAQPRNWLFDVAHV